MSRQLQYLTLPFEIFHFPMGIVQSGKNKIMVSYGGNDCHVILVEHLLSDILNSLYEV